LCDTTKDMVTICPAINKTSDRYKINKKRGRKRKTLSDDWTCDLCHLKPTCQKLCPPMQWIAEQVEIEPPKETPLSNPDYEQISKKWPETNTTSENIFCMFFFDRLTQEQIANKLYVTQQYVSKVVLKYKNILIKNLKK
jgi:hypothetical protein